jgi:hypothetical protein
MCTGKIIIIKMLNNKIDTEIYLKKEGLEEDFDLD